MVVVIDANGVGHGNILGLLFRTESSRIAGNLVSPERLSITSTVSAEELSFGVAFDQLRTGYNPRGSIILAAHAGMKCGTWNGALLADPREHTAPGFHPLEIDPAAARSIASDHGVVGYHGWSARAMVAPGRCRAIGVADAPSRSVHHQEV
jgi:hypothetical protein